MTWYIKHLWPQLKNCEAFVSPSEEDITELEKNIENGKKVGKWYKTSLESEKIKQTGIFQPEKTMSEVEYNTLL